MRIHLRGLAAVVVLGFGLSACAAPMGMVAGNVIGGAAWGAMKGGKVAWKGGSFAAKTTGRVVVGAAKGVHEEFSSKDHDQAEPAEKEPATVASADAKGAALAD